MRNVKWISSFEVKSPIVLDILPVNCIKVRIIWESAEKDVKHSQNSKFTVDVFH